MRTHEAYRHWVGQFQAFVKSKPCGTLGAGDVKDFLSDLAVTKGVAASSQNQAFNALLFFFRHVLGREFGKVDGVVRAKRRPHVPVTLSRGEVDALLARLDPPYRLVAGLLYGCGLRLTPEAAWARRCEDDHDLPADGARGDPEGSKEPAGSPVNLNSGMRTTDCTDCTDFDEVRCIALLHLPSESAG